MGAYSPRLVMKALLLVTVLLSVLLFFAVAQGPAPTMHIQLDPPGSFGPEIVNAYVDPRTGDRYILGSEGQLFVLNAKNVKLIDPIQLNFGNDPNYQPNNLMCFAPDPTHQQVHVVLLNATTFPTVYSVWKQALAAPFNLEYAFDISFPGLGAFVLGDATCQLQSTHSGPVLTFGVFASVSVPLTIQLIMYDLHNGNLHQMYNQTTVLERSTQRPFGSFYQLVDLEGLVVVLLSETSSDIYYINWKSGDFKYLENVDITPAQIAADGNLLFLLSDNDTPNAASSAAVKIFSLNDGIKETDHINISLPNASSCGFSVWPAVYNPIQQGLYFSTGAIVDCGGYNGVFLVDVSIDASTNTIAAVNYNLPFESGTQLSYMGNGFAALALDPSQETLVAFYGSSNYFATTGLLIFTAPLSSTASPTLTMDIASLPVMTNLYSACTHPTDHSTYWATVNLPGVVARIDGSSSSSSSPPKVTYVTLDESDFYQSGATVLGVFSGNILWASTAGGKLHGLDATTLAPLKEIDLYKAAGEPLGAGFLYDNFAVDVAADKLVIVYQMTGLVLATTFELSVSKFELLSFHVDSFQDDVNLGNLGKPFLWNHGTQLFFSKGLAGEGYIYTNLPLEKGTLNTTAVDTLASVGVDSFVDSAGYVYTAVFYNNINNYTTSVLSPSGDDMRFLLTYSTEHSILQGIQAESCWLLATNGELFDTTDFTVNGPQKMVFDSFSGVNALTFVNNHVAVSPDALQEYPIANWVDYYVLPSPGTCCNQSQSQCQSISSCSWCNNKCVQESYAKAVPFCQ
jgi:hypothetical protein